MAGRLTRHRGPRLAAIRIERASVRLGRHWALRDATFELRAGDRWLLVGPNGSGKTVLLKLLRGDLWPTPTGRERRAYLLDGAWQDQPLEAAERIAYLGPERQDRYDRHGLDAPVETVVATGLTGDDLLLAAPTAAQWRGVRRALADVGLAGLARRRFLTLSHGQRRRVLLARALVGRPDVLLLDEVLNGLDAGAQRAFLISLAGATPARVAWILTTHRTSERPSGAMRIARIRSGRLVARGDRPGDGSRDVGEVRPVRPASPARSRHPERAAASRPETLVELRRACVYRGERRVLGPLDWTLAEGEHWQVVGPNGAGKSSLIALLYGDLAVAAGGRILRRGHPPGTAIAEWKRGVGLVSPELQSIYAATACTAEEIVLSGSYSSIGLDDEPTVNERRHARKWLDRVGLRGLGVQQARQLSYGQLRRALVARALLRPRRLLLLDEPFDGLDLEGRQLVARLVAAAVEGGTQLVIAAHHPDDVPAYVMRRLELDGRGRAVR